MPVVAITLVSDAMSKTVSTVIGSSIGIERANAERLAINNFAVVADDDDRSRSKPLAIAFLTTASTGAKRS